MDLANIDLQAAADEGIEVKLQHPATGEYLLDEEGDHLTITVLGKDSTTWQNAAKRVNTRNANRYKDRKIPSTAMEAALYEILAESTVKWSKSLEFDGAALKCTKDNAAMLYEKRNWIAEQLMEAAADRSSYFLK
jgi:hypothetical protein